MGSFVNELFRSRNNMNEKCDEHEHFKNHQKSLKVANEFCCAVEHPLAGVLNLLDKKCMENIGRNREILKCIVKAILLCKQCTLHYDMGILKLITLAPILATSSAF